MELVRDVDSFPGPREFQVSSTQEMLTHAGVLSKTLANMKNKNERRKQTRLRKLGNKSEYEIAS